MNIDPKNDPTFEGFDASIEKIMQDWKVPGVGIAVIRDNQVVLAKGYGFRDVENRLPVDADTIFAIGSASKAFCSMAVGQLVDQGKLEWDKPVREYMPDFKVWDNFASERMSPRDLLCHRSGLPRHDLMWYNSPHTRKEIYERLRHLEPNKDFRTTFQYQNLMYMSAGYLVERVSGKTWEEFTKAETMQKLGMSRSNFSVEDSKKHDNIAFPYNKEKDQIKQVPFRNIDAIGPAGSINSTATDMAKWVIAHLNEGKYGEAQIISQGSLKQMHSSTTPIDSFIPGIENIRELGDMSYGLGWFLQPYRGRRLIHHGGNIDGFTSLISFMPDDKCGIVLLTNLNGTFCTYPMMLHIYDRLLGLEQLDLNSQFLELFQKMEKAAEEAKEKSASQKKPDTRPSHEPADYVGDFEHPAYGIAKIALEDGILKLTYNNILFNMEHYHYDYFNAKMAEGLEMEFKVCFFTDPQGNIASLSIPLESNVKDIVFTRKASEEMSKPEFLRQFTGKYRFMETQIIEVTLKEDHLTAVVMGQEADLEPYMGTQFKVKGTPASIEFKIVDGKVPGADLLQDGATFYAERIA
jgi:CubicO group peptidase (beta-lactamase class C family)